MKITRFRAIILVFSVLVGFSKARGDAAFGPDPTKWSDSEIRTFMFLAQIQNQMKPNLGNGSDLCLDVQPSGESMPGYIRVISKSGLFDTGRCDLDDTVKSSDNYANLTRIVKSVSEYGDALTKAHGEGTGNISAEVIGRTDGQRIQGNPNCSKGSADGSKKFGNNQSLGAFRADYLKEQLGLDKLFNNQVQSKSITSEEALAKTELKDCQTWRAAELKFNFNVGGPSGVAVGPWQAGVKKTSPKLQSILQIEATRTALRQYRDQLKSDLSDPKYRNQLCNEVKDQVLTAALKSEGEPRTSIKPTIQVIPWEKGCKFQYALPNGQLQEFGLAFTDFSGSLSSVFKNGMYLSPANPKLMASVNSFSKIDSAAPTLKDIRLRSIKNGNPNCDRTDQAETFLASISGSIAEPQKDPDASSKKPAVGPASITLGQFYQNLDQPISAKDLQNPFYTKLLDETSERVENKSGKWVSKYDNGAGRSTSNLKCFPVKNATAAILAESNCKRGSDFSEAKFPQDINMTCKQCGSGFCTLNHGSKMTFLSREEAYLTPKNLNTLPHNQSTQNPTYANFLGPELLEVKNNPNCIFSPQNTAQIQTIPVTDVRSSYASGNSKDKASSCFCSTPIADACGIEPKGNKEDEDIAPPVVSSMYFDLCNGNFKDVSFAPKKSAGGGSPSSEKMLGMESAISTFVGHDCSKASPQKTGEQSSSIKTGASCGPTAPGFEAIRQSVLNMTCAKQGFKVPTNDPVADCKK